MPIVFNRELTERWVNISAEIEKSLVSVRYDMVTGFAHQEYRELMEELNGAHEEACHLWVRLRKIHKKVDEHDKLKRQNGGR